MRHHGQPVAFFPIQGQQGKDFATLPANQGLDQMTLTALLHVLQNALHQYKYRRDLRNKLLVMRHQDKGPINYFDENDGAAGLLDTWPENNGYYGQVFGTSMVRLIENVMTELYRMVQSSAEQWKKYLEDAKFTMGEYLNTAGSPYDGCTHWIEGENFKLNYKAVTT